MKKKKNINQKPTKKQRMILPIHSPIWKKLESFYFMNRIPHLIFYGSSGCGKQTLVYQFLKLIYGLQKNNDVYRTNIDANVMFVNCAHGKGIKFIRDELKFFAKTNVNFNSGVMFKTIVLLNADHLTVDAQSALRRCIEQFSHNTRFFIVIENKHKLLTPILSRFCEIYVPDYLDKGVLVNLHQFQLDLTFPYRPQKQKQKVEELELFLGNISRENLTHQTIIQLVNTCYEEKAYSCADIIEWVKQSSFSDLEKSNICMCYSKIKAEFRCEKLLMMYMLDFMFFKPDTDIFELSFI